MRSLRDERAEFTASNTVVYGISAQGRESHRAFAEKNELNFPLLADPDGKITKAYGMLQHFTDEQREQAAQRGFDLPAFASRRGTFIIDPDGVIRHIDLKVSVRTHGEDLLKVLATLQGEGAPEGE